MKNILVTIGCLFISYYLQAQTWESYQKLYSDKDISVEIAFRTSPNACEQQGQVSRYKYRIKGKLSPAEKYVTWKMEYVDCNGLQFIETNSVNIGKSGFLGIVESMDFTYPSSQRITSFKEISLNSKEIKSKNEFRIVATILPDQIYGSKLVYKGQSTTLSAKRGTIGTGAEWEWYQDSCNGKFLGRGENITVHPKGNTTYFLKAVDAVSASECVFIDIQIDHQSRLPGEISGNQVICIGESIQLKADGGILGENTEWVWYEGQCDENEIGRSTSINVSPKQKATYFLKAVGENGTDHCIRKVVYVESASTSPLGVILETKDQICQGETVRLRVEGGQLGQGAIWAWYKNSFEEKNRLGSGVVLSNRPNENIEYLVRAEGYCNTTDYVSQSVKVTSKPSDASDIRVDGNQVFKNQSNTFKVVNRMGNEKDYHWKWKLDDHNGSIVGEGKEIVLKLKNPTTIIVYNQSECGNSSYFKKTFTPIKGNQTHQKYTSYHKFQFNWEIGPHVIGHTPSNDDKALNVGLGGDVGMHFYPLFKKYYSLGIGANVGAGTYINASLPHDDKNSRNHYFSFQPNIEIAAGAKGAKVLLAYSNKMHTEKYSIQGDESASTFQNSYRQDQFSAGFRFGAIDRKNGIIFFDIAYMTSKNHDWSWEQFHWKSKGESTWRHGWMMRISVHNAVNIDASMILKDVNTLYHKNSYRLGVKYYFNRYY